MRSAAVLVVLAGVALGGCASGGGPFPSLQPRAAEAIDPRIPVVNPMNDRPVSPSLASRLAELVSQAREGDAAFRPLADQAQRLAEAAGEPQSDSWVAAQQLLSAATEARGPTVRALGDIDEIGATLLQKQQGLAPADLAAIQNAEAEAGAIDRRQSETVATIQRRLGI